MELRGLCKSGLRVPVLSFDMGTLGSGVETGKLRPDQLSLAARTFSMRRSGRSHISATPTYSACEIN